MRKSSNVTLTVVATMGLAAHGQQVPPVNANPPGCQSIPQPNGAVVQDCGHHGFTGSGVNHHHRRGGFGAIGAMFKGGG
jgi:hypothetical protein